jgi:DNA-binding transcriptional LysR family regulator
MDRLAALEIFVRVVDTGSFSAVARNQQIGQRGFSGSARAIENDRGGGAEGGGE